MRYHHRYGVDTTSWPKFFAIMFMADAVFILMLLIAVRIYNNYMVVHDVQTIQKWCQTVLCVQIDPRTGVGTPAVPEAVPDDKQPTNVDIHEI